MVEALRLMGAAFIATALLLLAVPLAGAETTTKWYPDGDAHGTVSGVDIMHQNDPDGPDTFPALVAAGDCVTWAADQAAETDVSFDKSGWTGPIEADDGTADTDAPSGTYEIEIGVVASTGGFTPWVGPTNVDFFANGPDEDVGDFTTSESGTFTVPETDYLGAKFCNNHASDDISLQTDGSSQIQSPSDQPDYPTPELSTLTVSLAGLAGLAVVGRRRLA